MIFVRRVVQSRPHRGRTTKDLDFLHAHSANRSFQKNPWDDIWGVSFHSSLVLPDDLDQDGDRYLGAK